MPMTSLAAIFGPDARTEALAGAGVTATHAAAAFYNPALTAISDDSVSLMVPAIALSAQDKNNFVDSLDNFQRLNDQLQQDPLNPNLILEWQAALLGLDGNQVSADGNIGAALLVPNQYLNVTLSAGVSAEALAIGEVDERDFEGIPDPSMLNSNAQGLGVALTEVGVSLAREVRYANGDRLLLGVTPKYLRIDTYAYAATVDNFNSDDWRDSRFRTNKGGFNLDAGVAYQWRSGLRVGLSGRNLLDQSLKTSGEAIMPLTYQNSGLWALGAQYENDWMTLAVESELNATKRFKEFNDSSQFIKGAFAAKLSDWFEWRLGYKRDLKDSVRDLWSTGFGIDFASCVLLDVFAGYGENKNYALGGNFKFRF
ncbi:conjugal transfer protein TraF [Paraferrimonas sedimenticola]|uniref:Conjugal transfer protein TraF n=2 Tax=Paraferrimonas sedimenticola TaxID=375674 RepID=A0AA37RZG1_9GAMM|nr:conjugal transfer protein TraF [Paraferrimonas sedimenticola]